MSFMQTRHPVSPTAPTASAASTALSRLLRAFDAVATWVTQLSWWKFFLFAALLVVAGQILQSELFSGAEDDVTGSERGARRTEPSVSFDERGIYITQSGRKRSAAAIQDDVAAKAEVATHAAAEATRAQAEAARLRENAASEADRIKAEAMADVAKEKAQAARDAGRDAAAAARDAVQAARDAVAAGGAAQVAPALPAAPATPATAATPAAPAGKTVANDGAIHIDLPPQITDELSDAINSTVEERAEAKVKSYHKQASTWFISFVWLLVLALFGTKALVGGKKRAEAEMQSATAAAERESMQRQLSEAKMQAMQAQVEPHFLFNTLASVEHLIETDPPRASAMQRTLIQYLRAVIPQMRDANLTTSLGRELDMVTAYLDLLRMRMEERLTVDLQVPAGLRSAAFPPMMLQSMVENAIKHGLETKPEGGTLNVVAEVADSMLRVTVADDGVGFGVAPSKGTGLGLSNIRERLKLLHGESGRLHIGANAPSGVVATIEVPYKLAS